MKRWRGGTSVLPLTSSPALHACRQRAPETLEADDRHRRRRACRAVASLSRFAHRGRVRQPTIVIPVDARDTSRRNTQWAAPDMHCPSRGYEGGVHRRPRQQPIGRLSQYAQRLRDAYWPIPAGCAAIAGGGAVALVQLDEGLQRRGLRIAFTGGPDSSRSLLSTIASSTLTLTALVFSITIVVLQLASSQFSPRALSSFLRDRVSQVTLGTFLATFVFSLVTLREIRGQDGLVDRFIPGITISVAFGLAMASVGLFIVYIHHIAQSIRITNIVGRIAEETRATIERIYPQEEDQQRDSLDADGDGTEVLIAGPGRLLPAPRQGIVAHVNSAWLADRACEVGGVVWSLRPSVTSSLPAGRCCVCGVARTPTTSCPTPSSWRASAVPARMSPTGFASSSTSPSGYCRRASTTRQRL